MTAITGKRHLSPPRRHRSYPRVTKRASHSRYRVKKPRDHGTRHDSPPTIRLPGPKPQHPAWHPDHRPWQWPATA